MKMTYSVETPMPLVDFLKSLRYSRKFIRAIKLHDGKIEVNGQQRRMADVVETGDSVCVTFPVEPVGRCMAPCVNQIPIVYEDDYFLVMEKPAGMPCIPNNLYQHDTLANHIMGHYQSIGLKSTVHLISRLDKETSGLVLIAKHRLFHHLMSDDLKTYVKRDYVCFVSGSLDDCGTIDMPIHRHERDIKRFVDVLGKHARTHFKAVSLGSYSVVSCRLDTGRTHQIRVHLSTIGYPILGDRLYGSQVDCERHLLHSDQLTFFHPVKQQWVALKSDVSLAMLASSLMS